LPEDHLFLVSPARSRGRAQSIPGGERSSLPRPDGR